MSSHCSVFLSSGISFRCEVYITWSSYFSFFLFILYAFYSKWCSDFLWMYFQYFNVLVLFVIVFFSFRSCFSLMNSSGLRMSVYTCMVFASAHLRNIRFALVVAALFNTYVVDSRTIVLHVCFASFHPFFAKDSNVLVARYAVFIAFFIVSFLAETSRQVCSQIF